MDQVLGSSAVQLPDNGVLTMGPTSQGVFEYTPTKIGYDYFLYKATDGLLESNSAFAGLMVLAPPVDIHTDSDNNGTIDQTANEDAIEAPPSGGGGNYLHLNHDDDNNNGVQDRLEGPGPLELPGGGPFNDNDIEPAILKVDDMAASAWTASAAGGAQGYLNGVRLQISHSANLALWRTQNKEPLALSYAFTSQPSRSGTLCLTTAVYTHDNPVKHGLVRRPRDRP
jgi:hypothetical protein